MDAQSYSADGSVDSKMVSIRDVAWIDALQGQYAPLGDGGIDENPSRKYTWEEGDVRIGRLE